MTAAGGRLTVARVMLGALDAEVGHLALEDSGVGAPAARWERFDGDLLADPGAPRCRGCQGKKPGWEAAVRRAARGVRGKPSRSGSVSASSGDGVHEPADGVCTHR